MNYFKKFKHLISLKNHTLIEKSLLNCHVPGLHSFVLKENSDGTLVRMFVASSNHELHKNHCGHCKRIWDPLSVGIHPHHVDISIYPIYGFVWNVEFQVKKNKGVNQNDFLLDAYKWDSVILNGRGGFKWAGEKKLQLTEHRLMTWHRKYHMKSNELHTVYVTKGQPAAWIIEETPASAGYDAITYSNVDLTRWTSEGLYQKPTVEQIQEVFKEIEIDLH